MQMNRRKHREILLCWIAGLSFSGTVVTDSALAVCASTPAKAVAGEVGKSAAPSSSGGGAGFRVTFVRWDPVLRQRWAMVASCDHPEWPAVELPALLGRDPSSGRPGNGEGFLPVLPVVGAGDVVRLWSRQDDVRIEVAAMAEESGGLGKTVRVRLMPRNTLGPQLEEKLLGVVRGPHDVEMQR
jgi:hypothetical protein